MLWLAALLGCGASVPGPELPLLIRVTGADHEWHVQYPGRDRIPDTEDDVSGMRDLHVPVNTPVSVQLESRDYVYRFRIPDLGVNQVAIPDLSFSAEFEARSVGTLLLKGDQMCGYQHERLLGQVIVQDPREFEVWIDRQASAAAEGARRFHAAGPPPGSNP